MHEYEYVFWHLSYFNITCCNSFDSRYIVSTYGERIGDSPYPVVGNAAVCELKNKDRCYIKSVQFENKFWGGPEDISTTFSGHLVAPDAR